MANAIWEEGSLVELSRDTIVGATGWTPSYVAINRVGNLVALHSEAAFAAAAAALVASLPTEYCPAATVTDPSGDFTLSAAGALDYTASTAGGGTAVCQLVFQAALTSP